MNEMIKNVDSDKDGQIDYSEWLMTAVTKEKLLSQDKLEKAFLMMDKNGDKLISFDEVKSMLEQVAHIDREGFNRAIEGIDLKGKESVTLKQFKQLMVKLFD
jgi:calcium-dependent protein kinase